MRYAVKQRKLALNGSQKVGAMVSVQHLIIWSNIKTESRHTKFGAADPVYWEVEKINWSILGPPTKN
jgi:hypothetical protein